MLIVTGLIEVDPKDAPAMRRATAQAATITRTEDGCHIYAFYEDVEAEGRFRVYEEWASEDALAAHGKAAHMDEFRAKLGNITVLSRDIKKFDGGPKRDL